jgi:beta-N-acetylhexosaminidase
MIISGMDGTTAGKQTKRMIQDQHVGGVIFYKNNVTDPKSLVSYVNQLKECNQENPSPLFVSIDEEGGKESRLPRLEKIQDAWDIGKVNDSAYATDIGGFLSEACRVFGMNVDYAPALDISIL